MIPDNPQPLAPALIRRTLTYRWVCLGLLFLSGLLAFFTRLAPAVAIPDLQEAFVLNAAGRGLLTSLYLWPFALMQPLAGILTVLADVAAAVVSARAALETALINVETNLAAISDPSRGKELSERMTAVSWLAAEVDRTVRSIRSRISG